MSPGSSFTISMKHKKSTKDTEVYEVEVGQQDFVTQALAAVYINKGPFIVAGRPDRIRLTVEWE